MKDRSERIVRASLVAVVLLVVGLRPVAGYIHFPPPTLGALCERSANIYVLHVEKVNVASRMTVFTMTEQLKGKYKLATLKQTVRDKADVAKILGAWAAPGKTAILFTINGIYPGGHELAVGHVCLDEYWYSVAYDAKTKIWAVLKAEPTLQARYYGHAAKLRTAVVEILKGKEVVIPSLLNDGREGLEKRPPKVQRVRASLKLKDFDRKRDAVDGAPEAK